MSIIILENINELLILQNICIATNAMIGIHHVAAHKQAAIHAAYIKNLPFRAADEANAEKYEEGGRRVAIKLPKSATINR